MDLSRSHPELTPYVSSTRYGKPKQDFKALARALAQRVDTRRRLRVADVGCGNGELLHHLHRLHPHWELYGFDHTEAFVETARAFPGLAGVQFKHCDFMAIEGTYDVVTATCFLPLFADIGVPLGKLLDLCTEGGHVLATGLFNPFDIEVRVRFCDNTDPRTRGEWRSDFNRHSQQSVRRLLEGRAREVAFEECAYDIGVDPDPEHPIRVWSFRDERGKTLLVNGAAQLANQTLLIIRK
jgi:trans-aconitate methyltransferase